MKIKALVLLLLLPLIAVIPQNRNLENAMSSVVTVAVYKNSDFNQLFGFKTRSNVDEAYNKILDLSGSQGSGSGFVISRNNKKYIVTNSHVVEMASEERGSIYVYSINHTKYEVRIVGGDSFYDFALLEFVDQPGPEIKTVDFRKNDVFIGEKVFAIGNPLGEYPYSVSDGIIGGKNRLRDGATGRFGFLQSTATVIWGNSGGPLVDESGSVVGINSQIEIVKRGYNVFIQPQINFALEAGIANKLTDDVLKNNGFIKRAYLGVEIDRKYTVDHNNVVQFRTSHPVLSNVFQNSPSYTELKKYVGYQIKEINGSPVLNTQTALGELEKVIPNSNVKFTFINPQSGMESSVTVKSVELNPKLAGDLVKEVINFTSTVKYISDEDGLILQFTDSGSSFRILGAGTYKENFTKMWKVKSTSELAAAIRINGIYGEIDLISIPVNGDFNNMEVTNINFSDGNSYRRIVYY